MAEFLVIQAARFGDLVQTKRLLLSLATRGSVHLAVDTGLVPLAQRLFPFAIVYALAIHGQPNATALEMNRKILSRWRHMCFDAVYNCNFSGLTTALCRIFSPETVYGYRPENGGITRSPWTRLAFRLSTKRMLTPLNLVDFWAHFTDNPVPPASVNPSAKPEGRGIGIVLAGRESRRSLPIPVLARLTQTAFGALNGPKVFLFGTKTEQPAARQLLRELPAKMFDLVHDLSGKTDLTSLVDAVAGLDILLTPDTGIMHLAAHLGVPVQAFFLSSAWLHETGPYGKGHHVWQSTQQCAPCLECAHCPYNVCCGTPFTEEKMLRILANAILHASFNNPQQSQLPHKVSPIPAGLQLWYTTTDTLGAKPVLLAGEDPHAAHRNAIRAFLATQVHLPWKEHDVLPSNIQEWLCHDADWMLPQGRYC